MAALFLRSSRKLYPQLLQSNVLKRNLVRQHEITIKYPSAILIHKTSLSSSAEKIQSDILTLTLSDSCVKQIQKIADPGLFLRVLVESGGCSGFQYKFEMDSQLNEEDKVFEKDGAKIVIDPDSLQLINGGVVDFQTELIRSAFRVLDNPQAEHGCSCGASFTVKL